MPSRERMSPVDTAWLRMDSPGNLMMIVGVDVFGARIDAERLKRVLEKKLLAYRRFRSRVVQDVTGYWWELDPDFDMDRHLVRVALPGDGGKHELQRYVARLAGQALDPARPLWQFHLIEDYDGGSALIQRMHHCIADGMALMGVLMELTSTSPDDDGDEAAPAPAAEHEATPAAPWDALLKPFTANAVRAIDAAGDLATRALQAARAVLTDPNVASEAAGETLRVATRASQDAAALLLMDNDSPTSLKGRPGGSKAVAWCEPLPLADVKAVGKALGCSVNDVLLACAAGAIRGYLQARGEAAKGVEMRAMIPVNLRPPGSRSRSLGNKFGLVPLVLPVGIANPIERVLEVHRRMNELKDGYTAVLAMGILGAVGMLPQAVQSQVLSILANKASAVMTNVPGPQQQLYIAGTPLKQLLFWVPQSGDIGVGVSILSYHGGVQFGLVTDKRLCANPQDIIDRFAPEFAALSYALLLLPWDENVDPKLAERALFATEAVAQVATDLQQRGLEPPPAKPPARRRRPRRPAPRAAGAA
jgi:diacylglycerol O-acyltransferase